MKVSGPLHSEGASGDLAGVLTFQKRGRRAVVYRHAEPGSVRKASAEPNSEQVQMRAWYYEAVGKWRELTDEEKQIWNDFVR